MFFLSCRLPLCCWRYADIWKISFDLIFRRVHSSNDFLSPFWRYCRLWAVHSSIHLVTSLLIILHKNVRSCVGSKKLLTEFFMRMADLLCIITYKSTTAHWPTPLIRQHAEYSSYSVQIQFSKLGDLLRVSSPRWQKPPPLGWSFLCTPLPPPCSLVLPSQNHSLHPSPH